MKFCEKCGNKLKEDFAFCDKCGTKIVEKKKEKIIYEEKEDNMSTPVAPIIIKKGKGKIIFLCIMNILLLASTITFLVLWLTKPSTKEYKSSNGNESNSNNNKVVEKKKEENKFIGKWEQIIEYKSEDKVVQTIYGSIEFKSNNTYKMTYYDKDDKYNTIDEQDGTYTFNGNTANLEWIKDGKREKETITIKNNKLCLNSDCSNYLIKNGYNNKITVLIDDDKTEIDYIDYLEYNELLSSEKDAIVVIVKDGCVWCEKFESVVEELVDDYTTPVYYYKYDGNIDVSGTPTTIVIKNGNVVNIIEGYKELDDVEEILDNLLIK